MSIFWITSGL